MFVSFGEQRKNIYEKKNISFLKQFSLILTSVSLSDLWLWSQNLLHLASKNRKSKLLYYSTSLQKLNLFALISLQSLNKMVIVTALFSTIQLILWLYHNTFLILLILINLIFGTVVVKSIVYQEAVNQRRQISVFSIKHLCDSLYRNNLCNHYVSTIVTITRIRSHVSSSVVFVCEKLVCIANLW